MRSEGLFWGALLIMLGGLLLADNLGLLPVGFSVWSVFWPLVLIFLGMRALLGALGRGGRHEEQLRVPLESTRRATVQVRHGAGELVIDDRAGPDELVNGAFTGGVAQEVRRTGDTANVLLRVPSENIPVVWPGGMNQGFQWTVGLNPAVVYALDLEVGASRNILNLRNLKVSELRLQTGASASEVELPANAGETRVRLRSGMASVELRVPEGVGARIHAGGGLADIDIDKARFQPAGGEYRSLDYDTAANRVDIDIETGLGAVKVR